MPPGSPPSLPVGAAVARRFGPRYRWIILVICALGTFEVNFHAYAFATLLPTLMQDLGLGNSQAGSLLSAYFITYGLMQIPIGYVADRFGPRRVMVASLTLFSVGVFLIPLANNYATGLITRLLVGLGASAIYVPELRLMPSWFAQRRLGLIYGLLSSGSSIGASIALISVPWLAGFYGWRGGYLITAATVPLVLLLVWCCLARPADVGLPPLPGTAPGPSGPLVPFGPVLRRVLTNRLIWPYGWGTAIYYGGVAGILAWAPTF
ncbi:MAG TPA: MFS transporter, partial [Dehalococcoidia bacterium]|nr:MFS transporter [Dehalococcoidia bacterium]